MTAYPDLRFTSPRRLPKASSLAGRVAVLDIAFAATAGGGVSFETVTLPFIQALGGRLAAWVDHHDHDRHIDYANDPRFVLSSKAVHGGCPEMVTPAIVDDASPVGTVLTHVDLDGLYAAAKWILGGREPYAGADDDARKVDTRIGTPGAHAIWIDRALRARFRDDALKHAVVLWLVEGLRPGPHHDSIADAAREFDDRERGTRVLASRYERRGKVVVVDATDFRDPFDKTDLLLAGQKLAPVAIVRQSGMVTMAASYDSGWNFVELLALGGGMPTRVTVPESRLEEAISRINATQAQPGQAK